MQMNTRDEPEKSYKVALPENTFATVYLREGMSVEEFLASACQRKNLNPMEHFVRVKKRREMEDHNYFVPHRNDLIETYVSDWRSACVEHPYNLIIPLSLTTATHSRNG